MKAFLLLGLGLAAVLFVGIGKTVQIVAGKRYRVTSRLRGETNLSLIERGLAEFGATDVAVGDDVVIYTVNAKRTKSLRLGVDAFTFEDPQAPGVVVRLVVDEVEDAA
jgi:hypothetical protein